MKKNEKGISLLVLVISIVVMLLLTAIVLNSSLDSVEEVQEVKIEDEIKNLREAVVERRYNYDRNSFTYPLVGKPIGENVYEYLRSIPRLSSSEITDVLHEVGESYSKSTKDYFRLVGSTEALRLGVSNIEPDHYYVVDYNAMEVYGPIAPELVGDD